MQAHDLVSPYVRASEAIAQAPTDVVVVDSSGSLFAEDLIRNDPFLRNRPKVLDLTKLSDADIDRLCTHYSVAIFDQSQAAAFGIMSNKDSSLAGDRSRDLLRKAMSQRACGAVPLARTK
jgi:hypothetical protein